MYFLAVHTEFKYNNCRYQNQIMVVCRIYALGVKSMKSANTFILFVVLIVFTILFGGCGVVLTEKEKELPAEIAGLFEPPARYAEDFGDYKTVLKFYDGKAVKTAAEWKKRRAEIFERWGENLLYE